MTYDNNTQLSDCFRWSLIIVAGYGVIEGQAGDRPRFEQKHRWPPRLQLTSMRRIYPGHVNTNRKIWQGFLLPSTRALLYRQGTWVSSSAIRSEEARTPIEHNGRPQVVQLWKHDRSLKSCKSHRIELYKPCEGVVYWRTGFRDQSSIVSALESRWEEKKAARYLIISWHQKGQSDRSWLQHCCSMHGGACMITEGAGYLRTDAAFHQLFISDIMEGCRVAWFGYSSSTRDRYSSIAVLCTTIAFKYNACNLLNCCLYRSLSIGTTVSTCLYVNLCSS
jgi:hypothetical protein